MFDQKVFILQIEYYHEDISRHAPERVVLQEDFRNQFFKVNLKLQYI